MTFLQGLGIVGFFKELDRGEMLDEVHIMSDIMNFNELDVMLDFRMRILRKHYRS